MAKSLYKTMKIICENCDSEYTLKFQKQTVSGNPCQCAFCGEKIEDARDDDDEDYEDPLGDDESY